MQLLNCCTWASIVKKSPSSKPLVSMTTRASKRKKRQRSAQGVDESPNSSFHRFDTEKGSVKEEQVRGITQPTDN